MAIVPEFPLFISPEFTLYLTHVYGFFTGANIMFISPTNAVKMYDVSKPTLYKDMTDGKLSFTKDDRSRRKLNVAELDRIYAKRQDAPADLTSNNIKQEGVLTESNVNNERLVQQINAIREQIEQSKNGEIELLKEQIEQFKIQVKNLNQNFKETREEHRVYVRLLEDKQGEQGLKLLFGMKSFR